MFKKSIIINLNTLTKTVHTKVFGIVLNTKVTPIPKLGSHIRITWLPDHKNPFTGRTAANAYIGCEGCVDQLNFDGSFDLRLSTGGLLLVNKNYKFEVI